MSYMGAHNRVRRVRGSARGYSCVECGEAAREWAYIDGSPSELVDDLGRRYSRDLSAYQPMCFRCHRLLDKSHITHCPRGHPYEGVNLLMDQGKRKCRTCHYARARKRRRHVTPEAKQKRNEYQRAYRAGQGGAA